MSCCRKSGIRKPPVIEPSACRYLQRQGMGSKLIVKDNQLYLDLPIVGHIPIIEAAKCRGRTARRLLSILPLLTMVPRKGIKIADLPDSLTIAQFERILREYHVSS
jgi:hypothetical protein